MQRRFKKAVIRIAFLIMSTWNVDILRKAIRHLQKLKASYLAKRFKGQREIDYFRKDMYNAQRLWTYKKQTNIKAK